MKFCDMGKGLSIISSMLDTSRIETQFNKKHRLVAYELPL